MMIIDKSRRFGIISKNKKLVAEGMKLFEADFERQSYTPAYERFIVSPENARERLAAFIRRARKQLLIYDPNVCDDAMLRIITERIRAAARVHRQPEPPTSRAREPARGGRDRHRRKRRPPAATVLSARSVKSEG
jgi:hypothetical protein